MDTCLIPHSGYMLFRHCGVHDDEGVSDGEGDPTIEGDAVSNGDAAKDAVVECGSDLSGPEHLRRVVTLLLCSMWWAWVLLFLTLVLCASVVFVFEWHFAVE